MHPQLLDLKLADLQLADRRPADREPSDTKPPDRETANRGSPDRQRPDRQSARGPGRTGLRPEERIPVSPTHPATVARVSLRRMSAGHSILLVIQHVSWEEPHRILDACGGLTVRTVMPLAGDSLPNHANVSGAVVMGGPMNVDDVERYPALAAEREWLAEAVRGQMPILGICLGAQLLARSLGAVVKAGVPEIGFAPVDIHDPSDPIAGALAPQTRVLHWHGDIIELPDGAVALASSAQTEIQAFRQDNAWGLLFHPEADTALLESWLAEPEMAEEAIDALGADAPSELQSQARTAEDELIARSKPGFQAFSDLVSSYRPA